MRKLSIRTMLLLTLGCAILFSIFEYGTSSDDMFHLLAVLAFAIPGASWGYDISKNSRGLVVGTCVSAVAGASLLSAFVLVGGFR